MNHPILASILISAAVVFNAMAMPAKTAEKADDAPKTRRPLKLAKPAKTTKKADDTPKTRRPLSAYNIFIKVR